MGFVTDDRGGFERSWPFESEAGVLVVEGFRPRQVTWQDGDLGEVSLEPHQNLVVTVVDENETPISGATVRLLRGGTPPESGTTDARGEVALPRVDARSAQLQNAQVVTEKEAVFSTVPGVDRLRPPQRTPICGLMLAGDWTATLWPATMESAVRSGRLAAQAVLDAEGKSASLLVPDLRRGWLAKLLFR